MSRHKITIKGKVSEMQSDPSSAKKVDLKLPDSIDVSKLVQGDEDPMFVTIEVLSPTKSRNKVIYKEQDLYSLRDEINSKKPFAYNGHIKDEDASSKNPRAYTQWLYADVMEQDGKKRLYAKGYVFKSAKVLREKLRVADAIGKQIPVSIYGKANQSYNSELDGYEISDLSIESIDWARDFAQGVVGAGSVGVTKEMKKDNSDNSNMKTLKEMQLSEILNERADIKEMATVKEQQEAVLSEMSKELGVDADKLVSTLKETLQAKTKLEETNKTLQETVNAIELDKELSERVKVSAVRSVAKKMILTEMATGTSKADAVKKIMESEEFKGLNSAVNPKMPKGNNSKDNTEGSKVIYEA